MAYEIPCLDITLAAGADLSAKQYYFVKADGNLAAAGNPAVGVLQNDPTSGKAASVRVYGVTKVVAGGSISIGDRIASDSAGKAVLATAATVDTTSGSDSATAPVAGSNVLAIALTAGSSGETVSVLLVHSGLTK